MCVKAFRRWRKRRIFTLVKGFNMAGFGKRRIWHIYRAVNRQAGKTTTLSTRGTASAMADICFHDRLCAIQRDAA
ncbi:hypothetical protein KCP69_23255 [Salmonella enterica subsp. enterica]|nr:hypothetical protein KCP69_23255 [Salmonella enterica subsp. enterica]